MEFEIYVGFIKMSCNQRPFKCPVCCKTFSRLFTLKQHIVIHTDRKRDHKCSHCDKKFYSPRHLHSHLRQVHGKYNISCDMEVQKVLDGDDTRIVRSVCSSKFKTERALRNHQWYVHGVKSLKYHTTYNCSLCLASFKKLFNFKRHLSVKHDFGDKKCEICLGDFYYVYPCVVDNTAMNACVNCVRRRDNVVRKESRMVEKISEHFQSFVALQNQIIKHQRCSTRRRPDLLLSAPGDLHIVVECDEYQHCNYNSKCETGRMNEIMDEFNSGQIVFIRFNPDGYRKKNTSEHKHNICTEERLNVLIELINYVIQNYHNIPPMFVYYMYYSTNSQVITKSLPKKLVYCQDDFHDTSIKSTEIHVQNDAHDFEPIAKRTRIRRSTFSSSTPRTMSVFIHS